MDFRDDEDSLGISANAADNAELFKRKNNFRTAQEEAVKNGLHIIRNFQCTNTPTPYKNTVPYKDGILDAISRLFHIESQLACVSVAVKDSKLIVAFNTTGNFKKSAVVPTKEKIKQLFKLLKSNDQWDCYYNLVEFCIQNKHAFYLSEKEEVLQDSLDKVYNLVLQSEIKVSVGKFYDLLAKQYTSFGEFGRAFKEIEDSYHSIGKAISKFDLDFIPDSDSSEDSDSSSDDSSQDLNKALAIIQRDKSRILESMEKLEQDCYKVSKYFLEYVKVLSIKFIENTNVHSELRILEELGDNDSYIGCSKLSCFLCDIVLSQNETEQHKIHLGGHGIAYAMDKNDLPDILFTGRYQGAINNILSKVASCYGYEAEITSRTEPDGSLQYASISPFSEILGADALVGEG